MNGFILILICTFVNKIPLFPNNYVYPILNNIWTLLLMNIWSDPLIKEMDLMVNLQNYCNQWMHKVFLLFHIIQYQDRVHIICDSELKLHSQHYKALLLLQYSIFKKCVVPFYFQLCMLYVLCFLNNIVSFLKNFILPPFFSLWNY